MKNKHHRSAVELCSTGIEQFVRFRADAMQYIDASIESDAHYCLPKIIKAFMLHGAGDRQYASQISNLIAEVRPLLSATSGQESELLEVLCLVSAGRGEEGATAIEKMLSDSPDDIYLHVIAQEEMFWLGQADRMRDIVERAAPAWQQTDKDYGPFVSLRAFANEEAGHYDDAEFFGRAAVEIDPSDVWGAHAVAHVHLMKGEIRTGIDWLESLSGNWGQANQMQHHLWWHMCLLLLELGDYDRILDLLDTRVRNPDSPLVKASPAATIDINNYSSLLMRLELYGIDVSTHWQTLSAVCAARVSNHGSVFSNIHDMMVLTATGQSMKANALLDSMTHQFSLSEESDSVAVAYKAVGIPVCKAIIAHRNRDYQQVLNTLGGVRHKLQLMGASHAQRDVFYHLLVHAAGQQRQTDLRQLFLQEIEQLGFCNVPERAAYKTVHH